MIKEIDLSNEQKITLGTALSHYSQNFDYGDSKRWALEWVKNYLPDEYNRLLNVKETKFSNRGFVCRLMKRGMKITEDQISQLTQFFKNISSEETEDKEVYDKPLKKATKMNPIIFQLEDIIDAILSDNEINSVNCQGNKDELKEAMSWIEKEIINAQEQAAKQTKILEKLTSAYELCGGSKEKVARKTKNPSSKKTDFYKDQKNAAVKVNYLKTDSELGIESISPVKIVGSKETLVYNRDQRIACHYIAEPGKTLTFSGSSIRNLDMEKSYCKRIRKPELFFATPDRWKTLNAITTKSSRPKTHISESCLFVAVK